MSVRCARRYLVTGGAGFMGSAFIRHILQNNSEVEIVANLDLLTYAGNLQNLKAVESDKRHRFVHGDILKKSLVEELVRRHEIDTIVHFAAESHVDRSIEDPSLFYRTNVEGTVALLDVVRLFPKVHFHHISTDEVYGSIEEGEFFESSPYKPNSPYAASKAAADHFVRAYAHTYGLSTTISHSSNNFGPHQDFEKFIPLMIKNLMRKKTLPVYGQGLNIRDWLFVEDHARAVKTIIEKGERGQSYNISASARLRNIDLLQKLIEKVAMSKQEDSESFHKLIQFVKDRPGHDGRYALNAEKLGALGWSPKESFESRLDQTVKWYVDGK